ncbi:hypothetical protein [Streptomyces sp. NPDC059816]|uniref:hypothetical protein n=1 Tax=Streptomyces sp. NPDC059816 TaxID=3346960 RepID=UPI003661005D
MAALTAVGVFGVLGVFLVACTDGGTGTRDEGPARKEPGGQSVAPRTASPSPAPKRVNAVRLLMDDPKVSEGVKKDLRPCTGPEDGPPVDVSYGNLTGAAHPDVVVNVLSCGDNVGLGAYVYRPQGGDYTNVFRSEEPPVYAEIDRGDLVVTQQVYAEQDPVAFPSGEDVITYRWADGSFTEQARTHNDYSNAVGTPSAEPPGN